MPFLESWRVCLNVSLQLGQNSTLVLSRESSICCLTPSDAAVSAAGYETSL